MNGTHDSHENIADSDTRRVLPRRLLGMAGAILLAGAALPALADDPDATPGVNGRQADQIEGSLVVKRAKNTGKGMPSIRGPFPDTVGMEFLGQLTNEELGASRLVFTGASFLSDIWGWTSPVTGDEYAIVGTSSGVAFARITSASDPGATTPEFLGLLPTTNPDTLRNFWWDIKTFNNHAYITTEVNGAGVAIFDMRRLDGLPAAPLGTVFLADARYTKNGDFVRAHNISINEQTGFAYLTGVTQTGLTDDGVVILDLNGDPLDPVEVGTIQGVDSHDAQVVVYHGPDTDYQGREIAIVFNGGDLEVGIYDVTDKANIVTISETTYPGASFTHQGWLTEDQAILLVGDEEDELFGLSDPRNELLPDTARTYIWDVSDLDAPLVIGTFDSPAASIDHNLFVKGDRVYQAHYTAGIRVLDSSNAAAGVLSEVAHMDTEPRLPNNNLNHNINIFVGPWGVYPFFASDKIIASDGLNGLIVARLTE